MLSLRKMEKPDIPVLFDIAMRAFQADYDRYGVYPPLMKLKEKSFLPPRIFGKTILNDSEIIGGVFIVGLGKKGEMGSIFIDTPYQGMGYGGQIILMIEEMYPKVKNWKLETPAESLGLHKFYEGLGYVKTGEILEPKSGIKGFVYEKIV